MRTALPHPPGHARESGNLRLRRPSQTQLLTVGVAGLVALLAAPAFAQEQGWHYSPLAGEGDRAALGCAYNSTPETFVCIAVRCEEDYSVGVHLYTSRPGGDAGRWRLNVDREDAIEIGASADSAPYHARVEGDVSAIVDALKNGGVAYLEPQAGPQLPANGIPLTGSLRAINQALYFCAPRAGTPSGDEEAAVDGEHRAGDEAGEGRTEE